MQVLALRHMTHQVSRPDGIMARMVVQILVRPMHAVMSARLTDLTWSCITRHILIT